ncbi:FAD-dependent oxidoreductase [Candidatus Parcubacteria bacterium]|nr:FAD-dependent oxidoreductase [Candidatus Parcubacteria bacterium]
MIYDLIILGGGPAGITAGIYAARKKLNVLLLTSDFVGQTGKALHIENYPGFKNIAGNELMQKFVEHLRQFEIEIKEQEAVEITKTDKGFKVITKNNNSFEASAIVIASGRSPRMLNVEGEEKFIGKGVSYCPLCDATFFKDKRVIIVGGGNSGFGAAMELIKYAKKAFIFEFAPKVCADEVIQQQAIASGKIEVFLNVQLKEIKGNGKVESVVYNNDAEKKLYEIPIEGVFVEIGSVPASNLVKEFVDFSERGEVKVDSRTCQTRTPGIFAAGDITDIKYKQVIIAAAEGAKAALSAYEYLENEKQN